MEQNEIILRLKNAQLPFTDVISATYECSDHYDQNAKKINFYCVYCKSSYESGSLVYTQIWLPENWNGKLIALGNGGMADSIHVRELLNYSVLGYAAVQTDMGTSGGRERGINNQAVWRDFGWRATHGMAVLGKQLSEICYGKKPEYSYFVGASTGGQQAFSEAQRFPEDFNGIIAGVPANNRVALHTYFLWNHNHLRRPDGKVMFTDKEIQNITHLAVSFFQSRKDGAEGDNFVTYPTRDDHTITEFIAYLAKNGMDREQCDALTAVYTGPKDPKSGKRIYNGMPIGSEIYGCGIKDCQQAESPHFYPFIWCFGADYNGYNFNFSDDYKKIRDTLSADLDANRDDLSGFNERGGKMIVYSGSADPCVPYPDAEGYCNRLFDRFGGYEKTSEFFRYFLLPGRDHGSSGNGTNCEWATPEGGSLLDLLRAWCENNTAPNSITAARVENGSRIFTREIYPYGSKKNLRVADVNLCEIF